MRSLVILMALVLAGCASLSVDDVYRNPSFSYKSTQLTSLSFSQLEGATTVSIKNPNPYSLPVSDVDAELWLDGKPWLALDASALNGLAANKSSSIRLDWALVFDQLMQQAYSVYEQGEADFTLKMQPVLEVPLLGSKTVSWQAGFSVPVPKLPTIRLDSWRLTGASLTQVQLELDAKVFNPNVFSVKTSDMRLSMLNDGKSVAEISLQDMLLASKKSSLQTITLDIPILSAGAPLLNSLQSGNWSESLTLAWRGDWSSPDLGFDLPSLNGQWMELLK